MLYQINTRVWLKELSAKIGYTATLDDIPDKDLDEFAKTGFEWIWFLSVWQTGREGERISRTNTEWLKEFRETLDDFTEDDVPGSGFAITAYTAHENLGGDKALARLRKRMQDRGLKLMLDFVPNHTALDHHWVESHSEFYIKGNETVLSNEPQNFTKLKSATGELILAHGRDPFFPGWPDTLQLNYGNQDFREAMMNELLRIAGQCDGVRCDMAMLVLPEVFEKTWGLKCKSFWPEAIQKVKTVNPGFVFMAEVYWDLEWTLQQSGFDYTYDKMLYDRLKEGHAKQVHDHLKADLEYQNKMAHFLENHDEPRAAAEFPDKKHEAGAIITYFSKGLRFFHQGQFQGKKKRISPHLGRAPIEPINYGLEKFYQKLLSILRQPVFKYGEWQLIDALPAWDNNWTCDNYICFAWQGKDDNTKVIVAVNFSPGKSQCYLKFPFTGIKNKNWLLRDLFSDIVYQRQGDDLESKGLFLDEKGWKYYVFMIEQS